MKQCYKIWVVAIALFLLSSCASVATFSPQTRLLSEAMGFYYDSLKRQRHEFVGGKEEQIGESEFALSAGPWRKLRALPSNRPERFTDFCENKPQYIISNSVVEQFCTMYLAKSKSERQTAGYQVLTQISEVDYEYKSGRITWAVSARTLFKDDVEYAKRRNFPCWTCWQ